MTFVEREIELRLVARLKDGDAAAFEAIYGAFRPRLFSFLVRLSRRRDVAEELLEETWLRLVAHAAKLRDDTRLGPWLFTVARNLHTSWRRSRALEAERVDELVPSWPESERGESPFEAAARSETERRLEEALACLPLRDREVLLLVAGEGLTPGAAARACGVTPEALRKRLQRARARLMAEMAERADHARAKAG
jgi:RNA polymerase sigma-70 factor (ECF subfamily)